MIPQRVHTILISTQHTPEVSNEQIRKDIIEEVIKPIVPEKYLDEDTIYHINPSGKFVIGGPHGTAFLVRIGTVIFFVYLFWLSRLMGHVFASCNLQWHVVRISLERGRCEPSGWENSWELA